MVGLQLSQMLGYTEAHALVGNNRHFSPYCWMPRATEKQVQCTKKVSSGIGNPLNALECIHWNANRLGFQVQPSL